MRLRFWKSPDAITCHEVGQMLQSYLDGEVGPDRAQKVARHLEACRRCGLEASTYRRLKAALSGLSEDVDPEAVRRLQHFVDDLTGER